MKKQVSLISAALLLIASVAFSVLGQAETTGGLSTAEVDRIIQAFTIKEVQFRRALNQYSFKRDALIQSIGMGGQVSGEYHRVSTFTFDDQGNRFEKIGYFPMPTMVDVQVTPEDIEDLGGINPFALEPSKIAK